MGDEPFDFGKYQTGTGTHAVSLGFVPVETTVSGYLDEGAAETLTRLCPAQPGKITFVPYHRWWQVWKRRKPFTVVARLTGYTETDDGIAATFERVDEP